MGCAYTEATAKLSKVGITAAYAGVPNATYAAVKLTNRPDAYTALNDEGKGHVFECYATVLVIRQDIKQIRRLLYHIILTDPSPGRRRRQSSTA